MHKDEVKQLIEHHYFGLGNNKGVSDALNEYSIFLSGTLMRVDNEVKNAISDFESTWINEHEKMTGVSKEYLEFVKAEIEKEIVTVFNQQLKYWSQAERFNMDTA